MLGQLEAIDEFNNQGDLIGIDYDDPEMMAGLMGTLGKMNPLKRRKAIQRLTAAPMPSRGSRAEMEKHFRELPKHVKEAIKKGELRLADTIIYSIKPITSKTIKLFETQDDKEIGVRNLSNAKLPKNQSLLVSGIILLAGTAADNTKDAMMATEYDSIEAFPSLANGEVSLKSNKKQILPETSNNIFKTKGMSMVPVGYYKLANPRLIQDDVLIELTLELGTTTGIAANSYVWAGLHGTITTP